jgi:hypothetical protein
LASGYCFATCATVGVFDARCELASVEVEGLESDLARSLRESYALLLALPTYELLFVDPALLLLAAYDILIQDNPEARDCPASFGSSLQQAYEQLHDASSSLLCLTSRLEAPPCL